VPNLSAKSGSFSDEYPSITLCYSVIFVVVITLVLKTFVVITFVVIS